MAQSEAAGLYLTHEREGDQLAAAGHIERACAVYEQALVLNPSARWIVEKCEQLRQEQPVRLPPRRTGSTSRALYLFVPFYTPADPERAAELRYCLDRNLASRLFAQIILLIDDDTPLPHQDRRLRAIRLDRRPTYLDWVQASRQLCPGHISILANSDIHFDGSVGRIMEIFAADPKAFVALSRFDRLGESLAPHPNPHWSQDTWAFAPSSEEAPLHDQRLDIPLGVPRCDNKIAYVFATGGYRVYNPFPFVRSIHVHETNLRYYDKKGDRRIIGGVAMVHPGPSLIAPARLDIEIWSEASKQVSSVKLNRSLERWAEEERLAAEPRPSWVAHDGDWQYPAVTERHAFERMRALLPDAPGQYNVAYLGFPFATLVDLHAQLGPSHPRTRALQARLDALVPQLRRYSRVVSVAQHIRARQFPHLFADAGITDLFWSHCIYGEMAFPEAAAMRLRPFPLYPVQQTSRDASDFGRARRWLFSFVGARATESHLTNVRDLIIEVLGADARGKVVDRDCWHYQRIVYDAQVLRKANEREPGLVNDDHSAAYRKIMDESIFSLCPSGSGPNSIRLWEAMLNGSIPVILADTWAAPGPAELWERATVRCAETAEAVAALPDRLARMAADAEELRKMRTALLELARRYGPDGFVTDIAEMMEPARGRA